MIAALALALALTAPQDLVEVQNTVQIEGTYRLDQTHTWAPLSEKGWVGDCKDFALEKRKELMAKGYEAKRLVIWAAWENGAHAVLVVDRAWVLDSQRDGIKPLGHQKASLICPETDLSMLAKDNDLERCR
jgi:predicted transglutaminase-like cysteine proteinase